MFMKCSNNYFMLEVNEDVKITQFVYFPAPPYDFLLPGESVFGDWNQTFKASKIISHQIGLFKLAAIFFYWLVQ